MLLNQLMGSSLSLERFIFIIKQLMTSTNCSNIFSFSFSLFFFFIFHCGDSVNLTVMETLIPHCNHPESKTQQPNKCTPEWAPLSICLISAQYIRIHFRAHQSWKSETKLKHLVLLDSLCI